jgi:hypothetical protein
VDKKEEARNPASRRVMPIGNILGAARAESDVKMLSEAFLETADYRALTETQDFNFVVGRRGAGKSALFQKVAERFSKDATTLLHTETSTEDQTLALQSKLEELTSDYTQARASMRLVWRTHLLLQAVQLLNRHYKITKSPQHSMLLEFEARHKLALQTTGPQRCIEILKTALRPGISSHNLPNEIATTLHVERLQQTVRQALIDIKKQMVVLFDRLDEGWTPTPISTAVLGGLAQALADLTDGKTAIHGMAFVRDNMFRSLAHFDSDFSRNIEGNTSRLHWNEDALLALVAKRLRVAFQLELENNIKVWNRFAQNTLKDRNGFQRCLRHTLYRPRDILVLLNKAYANAARSDRTEIVEADVEMSAQAVSRERLADLIKEYDRVLPGLSLFIRAFEAGSAFGKIGDVIRLLDEASSNTTFQEIGSADFALFSSGKDILSALFSVGFIGSREQSGTGYIFCHDGSSSELDPSRVEVETVIHPCYWSALNLANDTPLQEIAIQVEDDGETTNKHDVSDLRIKMLGRVISQLPSLPLGSAGCQQFEEWVMRTLKILFSGRLSNFEWKPNADAIQRRDIVATNMANGDVWRRIVDDYGTRQVIFEVKNYATLKPEDYRQVSSYMTGDYGRFAFVITRSSNEGLDNVERGWIKEMWSSHRHLIVLIPAKLLSQWASKMRSDKKPSYVEDHLGRRIDTFVRSYLSLKHERVKGAKAKMGA